MKITRGRNLHAFWETLFKKFDKSRDYFQRKYKYLLNFYLRFYRRRRHTVIGNVLKFRGKRAVIAHNVLRIRGGLSSRRQKPKTRVIYGFPIAIRPKRKLKRKKKNKKKLPVQLQNVSSTTRPLLGENTRCNGENENIAQKDDVATVASPANSIVIGNTEKTHANNGATLSKTASSRETTPPNNEFDENCTNNIWNLDLATVALEMTDEYMESVDEDQPDGNTNGTSGKVCIELIVVFRFISDGDFFFVHLQLITSRETIQFRRQHQYSRVIGRYFVCRPIDRRRLWKISTKNCGDN